MSQLNGSFKNNYKQQPEPNGVTNGGTLTTQIVTHKTREPLHGPRQSDHQPSPDKIKLAKEPLNMISPLRITKHAFNYARRNARLHANSVCALRTTQAALFNSPVRWSRMKLYLAIVWRVNYPSLHKNSLAPTKRNESVSVSWEIFNARRSRFRCATFYLQAARR